MSAANWRGFLVRVNCGDIGIFEGRVSSINEQEGFLLLQNASLDGKFVPCSHVTIRTSDITDLKIVSTETMEFKQSDPNQPTSEGTKEQVTSQRKPAMGKKLFTPDKKRNSGNETKKSLKKKDAECFGTPLDKVNKPDFDFEKNLKLFDKEAIFEKLKGNGSATTPEKKTRSSERKLRHDENILEQEPVSMRQIVAPLEHTGREYHTDEGVVVPSISVELKKKLIRASESMGFNAAQWNENAGLCTCQMALQLIGGSHRLTQRNAHQTPHVVVLAGPNLVGIHSICAARHLANHKVQVTLFVPVKTENLVPHLALFFHTGCKLVSSIAELPTQPVDLVINALIGHDAEPEDEMSKLIPVIRWANNNKAPVLILDPCSRAKILGVEPKWSLAFALPLIEVPSDCRMYLADVGIPKGIFSAVDIKYTSPFEDKFVIALNE